MKSLLVFCLYLFPVMLMAQDGEQPKIDEGVGILQMSKPVSELKGKVKAIPAEKVRDSRFSAMVGDVYHAAYEMSPSKLGVKDYFGLKILFVEVYTIKTEEGEKVKSFILYLQKPKDDDQKEKFRLAMWERYDVPERMFDPDYKEIVHSTWWSDLTFLTIIHGIDVSSGDPIEFYKAMYEGEGG